MLITYFCYLQEKYKILFLKNYLLFYFKIVLKLFYSRLATPEASEETIRNKTIFPIRLRLVSFKLPSSKTLGKLKILYELNVNKIDPSFSKEILETHLLIFFCLNKKKNLPNIINNFLKLIC